MLILYFSTLIPYNSLLHCLFRYMVITGVCTRLCDTPSTSQMSGYLHKDLVYFPNRYLRCQVVMYLVQQRAYFLATHKLCLLGQYTGTGGDPGPFSYKSYLMHLLDHDSWGDHIVLYAISKLWEMWVTILHSSNLRETRICHKALGNAEVVVVFNDQAHYNGAGKDTLELALAHQFHSIMHQFCDFTCIKTALNGGLVFIFCSSL